MRTHSRLKGIAAGVVVVGLAGVGLVAIPAAANASVTPTVLRTYSLSPVINVSVNAGGNSITVNVDGEGTVTITIAGVSYTQTLVNGQATFQFPANLPIGSYPFTVSYQGPGGSSSVYSNTLYVTKFGTVVGIAAYRALLRANGVGVNRGGPSGSDSSDGSGSGSAGSDSGSNGSQGGLPATGASTQTELLGLLGLGLLTAGGASIVIARRRARV